MTDRRRFPRDVFPAPISGRAEVVDDCLVEAWSDDHAVLLTTYVAVEGGRFVMRLTSASGEVTRHAVRILTAEPIEGERRSFRLQVSVERTLSAQRGSTQAS